MKEGVEIVEPLALRKPLRPDELENRKKLSIAYPVGNVHFENFAIYIFVILNLPIDFVHLRT